jgi:hypothetical protein
LYERAPEWKDYERVLKVEWKKYLDGTEGMEAAVKAMVAALSSP